MATSDYDYLAISSSFVSQDNQLYFYFQFDGVDVGVYDISYWKWLLEEHEMYVIQTLFLPQQFVIKSFPFEFTIRHQQLMKAGMSCDVFNPLLIHKVLRESNRYKSLANRFISNNQLYQGKKKIMFTIRIIDFALQIIKHGSILDYSAMNTYYHQVRFLSGHSFNVIDHEGRI